ncbi:putative wound-induced protein, Wun1 [Medicago truncatula]|uniref:Putative wound-induced protein, Wun1 n=1 Tax=Medicago truncatula TaxID=3880 RepID=G7J0M4_MEDTR|nr:wound-induced protein 1 [Medicago truncatula]AES69542.1 wound-induced-like protein [Medicago truncatula]RHN67788.1 putative wound-induced protein, Wun1 [Medicago truncatula]
MKITPNEIMEENVSNASWTESELENRNRRVVKMVYKALLRGGETEKIAKVVGKELEWRYHGPPHCQHMMKMLTGESTQKSFKFRPRRMRSVMGDRLIVEGWEDVGEYWVHVWRVKDGIITQLREYFNTLLTVVSEDGNEGRLWRSTPWARVQGSLPDLVLSI